MKNSPLQDKCYAFAVRITRMYQFLNNDKKEFVLSKQILRSGTSIGANVAEAGYAQSKKDFIAKLSIAAKEAQETGYWLNLLCDTGYLEHRLRESLKQDLNEIQRMLTSSLKTAKANC